MDGNDTGKLTRNDGITWNKIRGNDDEWGGI